MKFSPSGYSRVFGHRLWQRVDKAGRALSVLENRHHDVAVLSSRHMPLFAEMQINEGDPYLHQFVLEPIDTVGPTHRFYRIVLLN